MNSKSFETLNYRQIILAEFERRRKRNHGYSMRAFSRDLSLSPSRLGEILRGKVGLSENRAALISEKLHLSEAGKLMFIDLVQSEHSRSPISRSAAQRRIKDRMQVSYKVDDDKFSQNPEWQTMALIQLSNIEEIEHSVESYSKLLGLSETQVKEYLQMISDLKISEYKEAIWVPRESNVSVGQDKQREAIKKCHDQLLDKAKSALKNDSVDTRDFSSVIFRLNRDQISYFKDKIEAFQRSLMKDLEAMPEKNEVLCLSLQLFKITDG